MKEKKWKLIVVLLVVVLLTGGIGYAIYKQFKPETLPEIKDDPVSLTFNCEDSSCNSLSFELPDKNVIFAVTDNQNEDEMGSNIIVKMNDKKVLDKDYETKFVLSGVVYYNDTFILTLKENAQMGKAYYYLINQDGQVIKEITNFDKNYVYTEEMVKYYERYFKIKNGLDYKLDKLIDYMNIADNKITFLTFTDNIPFWMQAYGGEFKCDFNGITSNTPVMEAYEISYLGAGKWSDPVKVYNGEITCQDLVERN